MTLFCHEAGTTCSAMKMNKQCSVHPEEYHICKVTAITLCKVTSKHCRNQPGATCTTSGRPLGSSDVWRINLDPLQPCSGMTFPQTLEEPGTACRGAKQYPGCATTPWMCSAHLRNNLALLQPCSSVSFLQTVKELCTACRGTKPLPHKEC